MSHCILITGTLACSATSLRYLFPSPQSQWRIAMPCPYAERILPISLGVSPCEICILSGSKKIACPPRRVIPASKELRVRVEEKKKSTNRVLSSSNRVGRSSPHFILRSKARCSTVSNSSLVHSCVLIKSRPRKLVFILSRSFLYILIVRYNPCSRLSCESFADGFRHGNQSSLSTVVEIVDDSIDLWPHAAFSKMTLFVIPFGLTERNAVQIKLVGLLEVQCSFLDGSRDQQEVCV